MKVEIWSDIMCPFCYIGKRRFEKALQEFPHKDELQIEWHSFQLDPALQYEPGKSVNEMLSERKGWSLEHTRKLNENVTQMAKEAGLDFNFDIAIPANTFDAHRLTHLAKAQGLQNKAEELLFSAFFVEGKNIGDKDTLIQIGTAAGLNAEEVKQMLESDKYKADVQKDIQEAQVIGVSGVPFFVLDRKYAISGAQASQSFLQALQQSWDEHQNK